MVWVFVFGGIALAGVVMLVCYGVWLAHKAADVMSEVAVLAERTGQLADLLGQVQIPGAPGSGFRSLDDDDDFRVRDVETIV